MARKTSASIWKGPKWFRGPRSRSLFEAKPNQFKRVRKETYPLSAVTLRGEGRRERGEASGKGKGGKGERGKGVGKRKAEARKNQKREE